MFYEIRRYQTQSGRRDEWVRYMEDAVIPYQRSKGMTVVTRVHPTSASPMQ